MPVGVDREQGPVIQGCGRELREMSAKDEVTEPCFNVYLDTLTKAR